MDERMNHGMQDFKKMTDVRIAEDIVQEYMNEEGTRCEWCFPEITSNSFHWFG